MAAIYMWPDNTYVPHTWEGYTYTQEEYAGPPDFQHPFYGESYNELTMSVIIRPTARPYWGEAETMFNIGGQGFVGLAIREQPGTGTQWIQYGLSTYDGTNGGYSRDISSGIHIIGNSDYAPWANWFWVAVSYNAVTGDCWFVVRNLSEGTEAVYDRSGFIDLQVPIEWDTVDLAPEGAATYCSWGTGTSEFDQIRFKGVISQELIHNKYIDLGILANRNKFCCLNGVKSLGSVGQAIFNEHPLVYIEDGYPENNLGTQFIGLPSDFWETVEFSRDVLIPPVCSG